MNLQGDVLPLDMHRLGKAEFICILLDEADTRSEHESEYLVPRMIYADSRPVVTRCVP